MNKNDVVLTVGIADSSLTDNNLANSMTVLMKHKYTTSCFNKILLVLLILSLN